MLIDRYVSITGMCLLMNHHHNIPEDGGDDWGNSPACFRYFTQGFCGFWTFCKETHEPWNRRSLGHDWFREWSRGKDEEAESVHCSSALLLPPPQSLHE